MLSSLLTEEFQTIFYTNYKCQQITNLYHLLKTPTNNPNPVDQELIDNEERSLTSLLNGADDPLFASQDESLRSLVGTEDESFRMLTLVRPSTIPKDVQKSPMHPIRELQCSILKANIRISTEFEEEKRVLTETVKDTRIQLPLVSLPVQ